MTGWIGTFSFGVFDKTAISCQLEVEVVCAHVTQTHLGFQSHARGLAASRQWPQRRTHLHAQGEGAGKSCAHELEPVPFLKGSEAAGKAQQRPSAIARRELVSWRVVAAGDVGSLKCSLSQGGEERRRNRRWY